MVEHLNHSRQLARHCEKVLESKSTTRDVAELCKKAVQLHHASTKFILPLGGRLLDDKELRAIDDDMPLSLPYPCIALEYRAQEREDNSRPTVTAPKRVLYAREVPGWIVVTIAFFDEDIMTWRILPDCGIPRINGIVRDMKSADGRAQFLVKFEREDVAHSDYSDELGALLCFLNVLSCSNVKTERSDPKKPGKPTKSGLPFDSYHLLVLESHGGQSSAGTGQTAGRSPREHLRRGHIRRLSDGRKVWVNATVVGAKGGAGAVVKDYAIA